MLTRNELESILMSFDVRGLLHDLLLEGDLQRQLPEVHAMVGFGGDDQGHKDLWEHTKKVVDQCPRDVTIRWAALFHDVGKVHCIARDAKGDITFHHHEAVSARLFKRAAARLGFFSAKESGYIEALIRDLGYIEAYESSWTDSAVRRLRKAVGESFFDLIQLSKSDITTKHENKKAAHHRRIQELLNRSEDIRKKDSITPPLPKGLGTAITDVLGIPPSAALGEAMKKVKFAVECGDLPWPVPIDLALEYLKSCIHPKSKSQETPET